MIEIEGYQVKGKPKRIRPTQETTAFPEPFMLENGLPGIRCSWDCKASVPLKIENGEGWLEVPVGWWIVKTNFSTIFHCPDHPFDESLNQTPEQAQQMKSEQDSFWHSMAPWLKQCPITLVPFSITEGGLWVEYGPLGRESMIRMINTAKVSPVLPDGELAALAAAVRASTADGVTIAPSMFDAIAALPMDMEGRENFWEEEEKGGSVNLTAYVQSRVETEGHADAFMTIWARMLATKKALAKSALNPNQFKKGRGQFHTFRSGAKRVGRNEPCPCGSKKKFKKCCA